MDVCYAQVDEDLPGYFMNNNKDLMNHDPKFPVICLTLFR